MPDSVEFVTSQPAVTIACDRVDLVALDLDVLGSLIEVDLAGTRARVPFAVDAEWMGLVPARRRHGQITADPSIAPWLARAIVLREEQRAIGYIGCHDRPDSRGRVELGYQLLPAYRRRGFAHEAIVGLLDWAVDQGATGLILSISPDNEPSLALARKLGLSQTGEQMDEIDGLELVFERSLPLGAGFY